MPIDNELFFFTFPLDSNFEVAKQIIKKESANTIDIDKDYRLRYFIDHSQVSSCIKVLGDSAWKHFLRSTATELQAIKVLIKDKSQPNSPSTTPEKSKVKKRANESPQESTDENKKQKNQQQER